MCPIFILLTLFTVKSPLAQRKCLKSRQHKLSNAQDTLSCASAETLELISKIPCHSEGAVVATEESLVFGVEPLRYAQGDIFEMTFREHPLHAND
mgnify:CR=1 FL=1